MNEKTPTREQRLNQNLHGIDTSTNPKEVKGLNQNKPRTINYLKALRVKLWEVLSC